MLGHIAYDLGQRRPGCVIVQAALGGSPGLVGRYFPSETWLLSPTNEMRVYPIEDEARLEQVLEVTMLAHELRQMEKADAARTS